MPTAIVASVGGETPGELVRLVRALEHAPCAAYEINFSCPNVARGGARYWADARRLETTTKKLRTLTARPIIAKLTPNATDPAALARACEQGGADAVSLVNTFVGTAIDLERRELRARPRRAAGCRARRSSRWRSRRSTKCRAR